MLRIRSAKPGDETRLSRIGAATFTETFGHLYKAEDLELFLARSHAPEAYRQILGDRGAAAWLLEDETAGVVGYASAGANTLPVDRPGVRDGELSRLYISAAHQGSGWGVALLETALAWLETNYADLYVSVYSENHGAQRLYRRYGFGFAKEYKYMVGNHADREFLFCRPAPG
jgi:ribosomal protein S18 acetylase RimI-like enzyme